MSLGHSLPFSLLLRHGKILLDSISTLFAGELFDPFALGCQNHKGNTENSICSSSKNLDIILPVTVEHLEDHLGTF